MNATVRCVITVTACVTCFLAAARAQDKSVRFNDETALEGWEIEGDVGIDKSKDRHIEEKPPAMPEEGGEPGGLEAEGITEDLLPNDEKHGALRVGPGGRAVWKLRDSNDSGHVEMWVYDNLQVPPDPSGYHTGPRWGLLQKDGKILAMGMMYARYLSGTKTYTAIDRWNEETWFDVQYLGECRRTMGWHRWTFDLDPEEGLSITFDGKEVKSFDWDRTHLTGFVGVVVLGDDERRHQQTVWVDDVKVRLGGPMKAEPTPPPPPPPPMPEEDPEVKAPVELSEEGRGGHPRLLFGEDDIPRIRDCARGAGSGFFEKLEDYLPYCGPPERPGFLGDATDAQRQGLWRLPTAALHYVITGEEDSLEKARGFLRMLLDLDNWEKGKETDSGMGAANIMIGAALAYDWLYQDLDPEFREKFRKKLLFHARSMYYRGHLKRSRATHYWQQDPQNNHRFHRNAGMTLCVLAAHTGSPEEEWILKKTFEELRFIRRWLPPDGSCHEGPTYFIFGGNHLMLGMHAADRCFEADFLDHPFFRNAPSFRLHTLSPGMKTTFPFGDGGGFGGYSDFLFRCTGRHDLADRQAGLLRLWDRHPNAFRYPWPTLIWFDRGLEKGSVDDLPNTAFFPDLSLALIREGWETGDVGAMFKCAPYGGWTLNEYRNENDFHYINVAHDDPDANSFLICADGELLAETSRYSKKKLTASHNTLLVGGRGQRGEGEGWTQPLRGDMSGMAYVTAWKDAGDVVVVEGESGGAYPALRRYRRSFIWVKGGYILILDDVRAKKRTRLEWLVQSGKVEPVGGPRPGARMQEGDAGGLAPSGALELGKELRYRLRKGEATCEFEMAHAFDPIALQEVGLEGWIGTSPADNRGKTLGWEQFRLQARTDLLRLATAFNPWHHEKLDVTLERTGRGSALVTVTGPDFTDTWRWRPAEDNESPTHLTGRREDGFEVVVDEEAAPPRP